MFRRTFRALCQFIDLDHAQTTNRVICDDTYETLKLLGGKPTAAALRMIPKGQASNKLAIFSSGIDAVDDEDGVLHVFGGFRNRIESEM